MDWIVIGAGPAGIASVGKLIDHGVSPEKISWIDPHFEVGDLGRKWGNVPSNTKVDLFHRFLNDCKAFSYKEKKGAFPIDSMHPEHNCLLNCIAEPLKWVTMHLRKQVHSFREIALALNLKNNKWEVTTESNSYHAKNVILAIGAETKNLSYPGKENIPLDVALNPEKLAKVVKPTDTIGVFGSSHSAVLILANLEKIKTKTIVNFYRSPHHYAIPMGDWILFDNTGLKGYAADWAKKNLDGKHPGNLKRILISDHAFEEILSQCDKVIYAVGFEKRATPVLEQYSSIRYNDKTGIIAPGLFGIGIAFPEAKYDPLMNLEYRVGLWKFMDYLNNILPIWLKYV